MGQFKPMVKMMTTEPSVELKLKKGGKVQKKADGGMMMPPPMPASPPPSAMPSPMPSRGAPMRGAPMGASPMKPSLAMRRRAMKAMPSGAGPAAPVGPMSAMMKKGGMAEGGKSDMAQDKAMIKKAFKQHDMQEHKGGKGTKLALKKGGMMSGGKACATGGVVNGNGGGYATGGVVNGNGGGYATGGVVNGQGGYKKGGSAKKAYAAGGTVDSGAPVAMKQGNKPAAKPISITALTGTYKRGGRVAPGNRELQGMSASENAPAFKAAKADSNLKYGRKMKDGGEIDLSNGEYDRVVNAPPMGMGFAKKAHKFIDGLFAPKKEAGAGRGFINPPAGSVTKSKEAVTVVPKKRGGAC
jgi:hypothetical protein